ncbi:DUF2946 family protein [Pseudomonas sp. Marseille-QA0892]
MRSLRRSRYSAFAALFAMCILFAGPLLSQALALAHAMAPAGQGHAAVHDHQVAPGSVEAQHRHGAASLHQGAQLDEQASSFGSAHGHAIWAKCGYCDLLLMCPAVGTQGYSVAENLPVGPVRLALGPVRNDVISPVFPGARSRAPPVLV